VRKLSEENKTEKKDVSRRGSITEAAAGLVEYEFECSKCGNMEKTVHPYPSNCQKCGNPLWRKDIHAKALAEIRRNKEASR
jgi:uncharacterized OB-fold protein